LTAVRFENDLTRNCRVLRQDFLPAGRLSVRGRIPSTSSGTTLRGLGVLVVPIAAPYMRGLSSYTPSRLLQLFPLKAES